MAGSSPLLRVILGLAPLALTPAFFFLAAEGYLNFGGGCKDVILVFPWVLWSFAYCICFLLVGRRGYSLPGSAALAAGGATVLLALAAAMLHLYAAGRLGVTTP
jgi:hypothetical protein